MTVPHYITIMWQEVRTGSDILLRSPSARRTLIWLHGLGDSADGFAPLFQQQLQLPDTNVLLLTAPQRAVTLNGGMVMNSWYDIKTLGAREINSEVLDSAERILRVIRDLPPQPIYLGGFSQGAAMSLFVALQNADLPIQGVIALSGYCFPITISAARIETPVFLYHGLDDSIIAEEKARRSYDAELGALTSKTYTTERSLAHSVSLTEIQTLKRWLLQLWST